jgi:predicted small metal-binding protein
MAKEVECEAPCRFRLRSENVEELVSMVQQHVKKTHGEKISKAAVLKLKIQKGEARTGNRWHGYLWQGNI